MRAVALVVSLALVASGCVIQNRRRTPDLGPGPTIAIGGLLVVGGAVGAIAVNERTENPGNANVLLFGMCVMAAVVGGVMILRGAVDLNAQTAPRTAYGAPPQQPPPP